MELRSVAGRTLFASSIARLLRNASADRAMQMREYSWKRLRDSGDLISSNQRPNLAIFVALLARFHMLFMGATLGASGRLLLGRALVLLVL